MAPMTMKPSSKARFPRRNSHGRKSRPPRTGDKLEGLEPRLAIGSLLTAYPNLVGLPGLEMPAHRPAHVQNAQSHRPFNLQSRLRSQPSRPLTTPASGATAHAAARHAGKLTHLSAHD